MSATPAMPPTMSTLATMVLPPETSTEFPVVRSRAYSVEDSGERQGSVDGFEKPYTATLTSA